MEELAFLSKPVKTMPYLEELHHTMVEVTGFGTSLLARQLVWGSQLYKVRFRFVVQRLKKLG